MGNHSKILVFILLLSIFYSLFSIVVLAVDINVNLNTTVSTCGNGVINSGEECDGSNLGGATCVSIGYGGGSLSCQSDCTYNRSQCIASPTPTPTPASGGGGGGGGGGGYVQTAPPASIVVKGRSYPNSAVSFLRDAQLISKVKADQQGNFEITESGLSGGSYNFSLWALDELNLRSNTYSFFLNIIANSTNNVLGILMPPTITLNKTTINPGEKIRIYGSSVPESFVIIEVRSEPMILSTKASTKGLYSDEILSSKLAKGTHTVKSKSKIGTGGESIFSSLLNFGIGVPAKKALIGDLNKDGKVNIIDFSILAFWYKKTGFPADFDLKQDGKIDLKDFSIMAFYWSG